MVKRKMGLVPFKWKRKLLHSTYPLNLFCILMLALDLQCFNLRHVKNESAPGMRHGFLSGGFLYSGPIFLSLLGNRAISLIISAKSQKSFIMPVIHHNLKLGVGMFSVPVHVTTFSHSVLVCRDALPHYPLESEQQLDKLTFSGRKSLVW